MFRFGARLGEPPERELLLEVMGNYSNLLLADGQGTLLGAAHQVGSKQSRVRPLAAGHPYAPPPPQGGMLPVAGLPQAEWRETLQKAAELPRAKGDVAGALVRAPLRPRSPPFFPAELRVCLWGACGESPEKDD